MTAKPKKVPLATWAAARYDPVPPIHTLRRWAREGQIVPAAEKVGGEFYCLATAERKGVPRAEGYVPLADRIGA